MTILTILSFCRHRTLGWEGVIFQGDDDRIQVTNGIEIWENPDHLWGGLEMAKEIDLTKLCAALENHHQHQEQLLKELREYPNRPLSPDQEYLARPLLEGTTFVIQSDEIKISTPSSVLVQVRSPVRLRYKKLMADYREVLALAKERNLCISFVNHFRRKIRANWHSYQTELEKQCCLYESLMEWARCIQIRGVHVGYRDDAALQSCGDQCAKYMEHFYSHAICTQMVWIAKELSAHRLELDGNPEMRGKDTKIYL